MTRAEAFEELRSRYGSDPDWDRIAWLLNRKQLDSFDSQDWVLVVQQIQESRTKPGQPD